MDKQKLIDTLQEVAKQWLHDSSDSICYVDINSGSCGEFAYDVWSSLGQPTDVKIMQTSDYFKENSLENYGAEGYSTHIWLSYNDRHYDIERINGVDDFLDLPYFSRERYQKANSLNEVELSKLLMENPESYPTLLVSDFVK